MRSSRRREQAASRGRSRHRQLDLRAPAAARGCSPDLAAELINHAFAFEAGEAKVQHDSG